MKIALARVRILLLLLLVLGLALAGKGSVLAAQENSQYFPQTGHTLSGKFLQYWQANGGLPTFGYPITDAQNEVDPETGKTFLTQWFERNRFELHPENAGTKYEVLLGLLGKDLKREALQVDPYFQPASPLSTGGTQFFSATRHNVGGRFLQYWQVNGGLERFGYPVSEEHPELDPETGQVFVMQWFERARFEYHPQNQPPYDVLLGLLGNQLKSSRSHLEVAWQIQAGTGHLAVGPDHLYVAANGTVKQYSVAGIYQATWDVSGTGRTSQTGEPGQVATDAQGNLYVVNSYRVSLGGDNFTTGLRLDKFDSTGKFVMTLVDWKQPAGATILRQINGLTLDNQNNIYVLISGRVVGGFANPTSSFVEKYDPTGKKLLVLGQDGSGDGQFAFSNPARGLAVDNSGNIYVGDADNYRIEKFDSAGRFVTKWGTRGSGNGQFDGLVALAVDRQNNIYALATAGLQKFDSNGSFLAKWGSVGQGEGQFNRPTDLAVEAGNNLYVSDTSRLQKFHLR